MNNTLGGSWITIVEDRKNVSSDDAERVTFSKDGKDEGKITIETYEDGKQQDIYRGTYRISDKGQTLDINASSADVSYRSTGKISDRSKTKFTYAQTVTISGTKAGLTLAYTGSSIITLEKQ